MPSERNGENRLLCYRNSTRRKAKKNKDSQESAHSKLEANGREHHAQPEVENQPQEGNEHGKLNPEQSKESKDNEPKESKDNEPKESKDNEPKESKGNAVRPNEHLSERQSDNKKESADWMSEKERAILDDMYESGDFDGVASDGKYSDVEPQKGKDHLPTKKTGSFDGERGNSTFHPNSPDAQAILDQYGKDGVEYKNGKPDFLPFSTHSSPWGDVDSNVTIGHMTGNRTNPTSEYGRRKDAHDVNSDLGNYEQADNELASKMNKENPDLALTGKDIEKWRNDNDLTWHELPDGESMQLVPTDLHDACRHSGGKSEMNYRQAWGALYVD